MDGDGFPCGSSQEMKTEKKARKRCIKSCKQGVCSLLDGDLSWRSMVPRKKRSVKMPVINIKEEEKEKAAVSLMELSKDTRPWGSTAAHCSNSQASDDDTDEYFNASVLLSHEDEFKKPAWNIVDEFIREKEWKKEVNDHGNAAGLESGLKSVKKKMMMIKRFECGICGKAFGSGQGLGCHKRAHKVS